MGKATILLVTSCYRGFGGIETVMNYLCVGLNKLGYETAIGAFSFQQDPPSSIKKINLQRFKNLKSNPTGNDFNIVHTHQARMNYCSLFTPEPFIYHYHGTNGLIQKIYFKISALLWKNRITKTIAVSNSALNQMQKMTGKIPVEIVYNGVDTKSYHPNLSQPFRKGNPQLLFVGNLYPTKNTPKIIEAMPQILQVFADAHLQIVGTGKEYFKLKKIIKKHGLKNNVELVGSVTEKELPLRFSSCDLYISASKYEAHPVPPMEAMGCGKPLVLSDIEPHKEMIKMSKAGMTFSLLDPSDICRKIQDVYRRKEFFSSNAKLFIKNYDWDLVCKKVASVYDNIML